MMSFSLKLSKNIHKLTIFIKGPASILVDLNDAGKPTSKASVQYLGLMKNKSITVI